LERDELDESRRENGTSNGEGEGGGEEGGVEEGGVEVVLSESEQLARDQLESTDPRQINYELVRIRAELKTLLQVL
jgi:hypothetical protein